jgi:hypothetical protein
MFEPGTETSNVDGVMDGQIDDFLKAYLMMMGQKKRNNYTYFFFNRILKPDRIQFLVGFFCIPFMQI